MGRSASPRSQLRRQHNHRSRAAPGARRRCAPALHMHLITRPQVAHPTPRAPALISASRSCAKPDRPVTSPAGPAAGISCCRSAQPQLPIASAERLHLVSTWLHCAGWTSRRQPAGEGPPTTRGGSMCAQAMEYVGAAPSPLAAVDEPPEAVAVAGRVHEHPRIHRHRYRAAPSHRPGVCQVVHRRTD